MRFSSVSLLVAPARNTFSIPITTNVNRAYHDTNTVLTLQTKSQTSVESKVRRQLQKLTA